MQQTDKQNEKKENKKENSLLGKLCIFLALLCLVAWGISAVMEGEGGSPEENVAYEENGQKSGSVPDWIVVKLLPVNEYSRPGTPLKQVNGIVVHYVANPGSNGWENRDYFAGLAETHTTKAGAHFIIGLDGTVIQCVPLNELTYCSNSRNVDTVSIECCHPDKDGKFTKKTYRSLIKLCKWLMERYGLETEDVIRHYDVTGKLCPLYFVEHEDAWELFKEQLK
ncbi:MAG: peptidoglycan recognition family protein [Lachnospiraceae bacterium]|nr:peptidoglycan recognition family protein [Lachnospiraceae bacterium]